MAPLAGRARRQRRLRAAFDIDFLVHQGVIDVEDRDLFWYAETAQETWDGIADWYSKAGEPASSATDPGHGALDK
ncbi:MAG: hypothetical protein U5K76_13815 [Woeseiaceae bacterium]|nr:hypothetical protein [Woeseiaceae bacterium]